MIVMETGYVEQHRSDPGRSDRLRFTSRSDAVLINIAGQQLTSDRLTEMIN